MKSKNPVVPPLEQKRYKISVTQEDIDRAHLKNSYKCVVTQAIARTIPDATQIQTDLQAVRFTRQDTRFVFFTPAETSGYVIAFDAGEPIFPFSFVLQNPMITKRRILTEKGRAAARAKVAAGRAIDPNYAGQGKARKRGGEETPAEVKEQARDAAMAAYRHAIDTISGPTGQTTDAPNPQRRATFHRQRMRTYGSRLLRINRDRAKVEEFGMTEPSVNDVDQPISGE